MSGEGQTAIIFFTTAAVLSFGCAQYCCLKQDNFRFIYTSFLYGCLTCLIYFAPLRWVFMGIANRAMLIGTVFGAALVLSFSSSTWNILGWYFVSLSFFHFSEYIMTAVYNINRLSLDSFLLNHSLEYQLAAVASWIEFLIEMLLFPKMKSFKWISMFGLTLVIFGESVRKLAMIHAKSNFSHVVQTNKQSGHMLVTDGIYALTRHPSYVGWFYWSVGTQILLCNPICLIGYAWASWQFFIDRVREEEYYLAQFFGEDYIKYMKRVPTRLPFNKGLQDEIWMLEKQLERD